jgi:integrase
MIAQEKQHDKIVPMPKAKTKLEPGVKEVIKNGKTKFEHTFFVKGVRSRKYFNTKTDANRSAKAIASGKKNSTAALLKLPDEVLIDLFNVYNRAKRAGYDLNSACERFESGGECFPPIKFKEASEAFLAAKRAKNCRHRTITTYQSIIECFGDTFDGFDFHEITQADVLEFLACRGIEPRTFNNYLTNLTTVRNWAKAQKYDVGKLDPFGIEERLLDDSDPAILEVNEIEAYVRAALAVPVLGLVVVLVLFCGLRVAEAIRTQVKDIKLDRKTPIVVVRGQAAKLRNKRNVELQPNAVAWLRAAIDAGCQVPVAEPTFFNNRNKSLPKTGANALRHSFCSYHVAKFTNKNLTAHLAGNSPEVIATNYLELVEPEDADEFWSLMP